MRSLSAGIAGTAKNTGKTTTMSYLMEEIRKRGGHTLGLTSIGYDGESFDNVTGLPKPRIDVWPGTIAAIAERCLQSGGAKLEEIANTGITTPLGKVVICRVVGPGKLILAGANNRRDLRVVLDIMDEWADLVFVDGALNRIAPMAEVDCLILATGAARTTDIPLLARESGCIVEILSTPVIKEEGRVVEFGSVLTQAAYESFLKESAGADTIRIQGVFTAVYLEKLAELYSDKLKGKRLIFTDPLKLLLSGDAVQARGILRSLAAASVTTGVEKTCSLLGITLNPYYPEFRFSREDYQAAYVDGEELLRSVSGYAAVPCYDVIRQGGQRLVASILDKLPYGKSRKEAEGADDDAINR